MAGRGAEAECAEGIGSSDLGLTLGGGGEVVSQNRTVGGSANIPEQCHRYAIGTP